VPKAGEVTSTTADAALGTTTFTLANNMKVTIKTTDFKSDEILLSGKRKGGLSRFPLADRKSAEYASNVVDAMGLGNHTPTDLQKILSGKTITANLDFTETEDVISASSSVKDFETMLQALHLNMTSPRVDEPLFKAFVSKNKQQVMFISSNPQAAFIDTTLKTLYNNSPYAPNPIPKVADFDAINMNKSVEIFKEAFSNPSGFHMFLVGNITPEQAKPLLETYLGSLTAKGATPSIKDNGARPVAGKTMLKVQKGTEKQSLIVASYHGEAPYTEETALRAQAVAEILNIKVIEDLREKLGGIYTGGYYAQVAKEPYPHYAVMMQLPCGPENVDKLLAAAAEEIQDLKANGPSATDLDKVKSQWKEAHRTSVRENKYWTAKLADIMLYDRSKENVLNYDKWIDRLTPSDVQSAAKMLFDGKNEFVSVLYPEGTIK
jgi:zinc protease